MTGCWLGACSQPPRPTVSNRCVTVRYANSLGTAAGIEHLQLSETYRPPLCLFADSRSAIQAVTSDSSQPTRLALIRIGAGKVPVRM
jgi:hypothetical protein